MRMNNFIKKVFFIIGILSITTTLGFGQGFLDKLKNKVKSEAKNQTNQVSSGSYCFARIEVNSSWQEKNEEKHESRAYYSNIIPYTIGDSKMVENLALYFEDGIVTPMKARGIEIDFYDSDITVFPYSYSYETVEEAQKEMDERMDTDKYNQTTIYSFVWKYNQAATGEEMTQPKRIFSVKPAPSIENTKVAPNNNAAERIAKQKAEKQENEIAQQQKQIWGFAILNVRVRNSKGEEFSRTYVSEVAPVTRDDYNAFYNTDERFIKPRIWDYFNATVVQAAKVRGEEIQEPYDSSIIFKFSLDRDGNLNPLFRPKSVLDEPRQREIGYAKDSSRPVFYFRWDTSGKNSQADLQKELKRGNSAELPN